MNDSIRLPEGFRFAGMNCGIKPAKSDLAMIVVDKAANGFGVYTQNLVRAACIDWNRSLTPLNGVRGIVVNSGNANACTGAEGIANNKQMAQIAADSLAGIGLPTKAKQMFVLSTGVIGRQLPMSSLEQGIPKVVSHLQNDAGAFDSAANAILTTDKNRKIASRSWQVGNQSFTIAAMAKGAGMIGPNMATMLGVLVTDFPVASEQGQSMLQRVVDRSFNRISVEGHTSTNDAVILLAADSAPGIQSVVAHDEFECYLLELSIELAKKIPTDGEGADHLIEIRVLGTQSDVEAERIARTIALSNLVKTAVAGADPNWGRIVSAAGYSGVSFDVEQTSLTLNGTKVFERGSPVAFDNKAVSKSIKNAVLTQIDLIVGGGRGSATHWTSDLTVDYVKLNAEYTT